MMEKKKNVVNWFEIPVKDIERAKKFYTAILGTKFEDYPENEEMKMAMFPMDMEAPFTSGALLQSETSEPSKVGTIVYFDASPDLSVVLDKIEANGGKILMPKTSIGESGFIAYFQDIEGNRVALHSMA